MSDRINESDKDKTPQNVNETSSENISEEESTIFSAPAKKPTKQDEQKNEKKPKKKGLFFAIIAIVVCLVLVGGIFAILKFVKTDEGDDSSSASSGTSYPVYDYSAYASSNDDTEYLNLGGITSVTINNNKAHYTATPTEKIQTTTDSSTGESKTSVTLEWGITNSFETDLTGVEISKTYLKYAVSETLVVSGFAVYADDVNATIPSGNMTYKQECGLDKPQCTADIVFAEGSSLTLYVGNLTPTKDGYFIYVDAHPNTERKPIVTADGETIPILGLPVKDNHIYKVSEESLTFSLADFNTLVERQIVQQVDTSNSTITSEYSAYGSLIEFDAVSLTTKAIGTTYNFSCIETSTTPGTSNIYFVGEPENFNPDGDRVEELLKPISEGLRSVNCYELQANASNLAKYGFDDPIGSVTYVINGTKVSLVAGKEFEEGYYSVMVDGKVSIYKVSKDSLTFMTTTKEQWRDKKLYSSYITTVSQMDMQIRNDDGSYSRTTFLLEHKTADNTNDSLTVTTAEGYTIDTDKFRDMYANIVSTSIEGDYSTDGVESNDPKVMITMHYVGYTDTDVLKYSDYSARRYYFTLNGKNGAPVLSTVVDNIISSYNTAMATAH